MASAEEGQTGEEMRLNSFEAELIRDWHSAMTHEKGQERSSLSSGLVMADDSDNAIVSLNSAFKEKKTSFLFH